MMRRLYHWTLNSLPPALSQRFQYLLAHGRLPDLREPKTFNEHVLRMKLTWDDPRHVPFADKLAVKDIVAERLGPEWVTPTLWSGTSFPQDPDFPFPYVVKANHGSGQVAFVRSPDDEVGLAERVSGWLEKRLARKWAEGWYAHIEPKLLVEPMLGDGVEAPLDYKFYGFDGTVVCVQVDTGRFGEHKRSFYDPSWGKLRIEFGYPIDPADIPAPESLSEMVSAASELSRGFDFARVDFYELESGPRFGEVTFAPASGLTRYEPRSADEWLGTFWPERPAGRSAATAAGRHKLV